MIVEFLSRFMRFTIALLCILGAFSAAGAQNTGSPRISGKSPKHTIDPPPPPPGGGGGGGGNTGGGVPDTTTLVIRVTDIQLEGVVGTGTAPSFTFPLIFSGSDRAWSVKTTTENGVNWLTVTPVAGDDERSLTVYAAVGKLLPGVYKGNVIIKADDAIGSPKTIPVVFRVRPLIPSTLVAGQTTVNFTSVEGGGNPPPQTIKLQRQGEVAVNWTVTAATFNGGAWLAHTPNSGKDEGSITLRAAAGDLPQGTYAGKVTVASPTALNSPVTLNVVFSLGRGKAAIAKGDAYNAATLKAGPAAPGGIIVLYGARLGPREAAIGVYDEAKGGYPLELGGTKVMIGNQPAPLLLVSEGQINLQVPFETSGRKTVPVIVQPANFEAATFPLTIEETTPGIFTVDGNRAAAINQDGSINSIENPANAGSEIKLHITGHGPVAPPVATGQLAADGALPSKPVSPLVLTFNGVELKPKSVSLSLSMLGLLQITLAIPADSPQNDNATVKVKIGNSESNIVLVSVAPQKSPEGDKLED